VTTEVSVEAGVGRLGPGQEAAAGHLAPMEAGSCGSLPGGVSLAAPVQLPPEPLV